MKLPMIILAALAAAPAVYSSVFLTANMSGTFPGTATLGGVALGAPTDFSISATFDATANQNSFGGNTGDFQVTSLSLTLTGHGTFTGTSGALPLVYLTHRCSVEG